VRVSPPAALVFALLASCAARAEVIVFVDVEPLADAVDRVVVRVRSDDGAVRLDETRAAVDVTWPLRVPVVPEGGDAGRGWIVEAELLDASGALVSAARAHGGYVSGEVHEALLCLTPGCAALACTACADARSDCTTCARGACVDARAVLLARGASPRCPGGCLTAESACSDGMDEDCDALVDCEDPDCGCGLDGAAADAQSDDAGTCTAESTLAACHDGLDDDCDGLADCNEGPDCVFVESAAAGTCGNALDDDCDGMIDCEEPSCAQASCGARGLRCCGGVCTDTWSDEANCGACGISCASTRICTHVLDTAGGAVVGGACRCGTASECLGGSTCESHDGSLVCDCVDDGDCTAATSCHHQGVMHHAYCGY
jgi:hypothetical protein